MSRSTTTTDFGQPIRGWRDRETGTIHLFDCFDFDSLDASTIQDVVWSPGQRYERLCPWCFAGLGDDIASRQN